MGEIPAVKSEDAPGPEELSCVWPNRRKICYAHELLFGAAVAGRATTCPTARGCDTAPPVAAFHVYCLIVASERACVSAAPNQRPSVRFLQVIC